MNRLFLLLILLVRPIIAQAFTLEKVVGVPNVSFRGLSVVNSTTAWVSGTKGYVGISTNAGKNWAFKQVPGYGHCDFRTLYAFDAKTAIIANAGIPAVILRTTDAGASWQQVYKNDDTSAFIDGVDFWNNNDGILYGDPIKGHMMILLTHNGGRTWHELPLTGSPPLAQGEASFAASGTCVHCFKNGRAIIATGGTHSRLWISNDKGLSWTFLKTPIIQGLPTTGIFSFAFLNDKDGTIVGGDYKRDTLKANHIFYTNDGGQTWLAPVTPTRGYRECVCYLSADTLIATGPTGSDISIDAGRAWKPFSNEKGFHTIRKSRTGNLIIMTGTGQISVVNS